VSRALTASARPAGPAVEFHSAGILLSGVCLLLFRPLASDLPGAVLIMGGTYVLLAAMSLAHPEPRPGPAVASPSQVVAVGAGAFLLSGLVSGPSIPFPIARSALFLNTLAAVAEEAFFRRFLFGRLVRHGAGVAVVGSAVLFALVHVPAYGMPVLWVDLGAGLMLSWQRWASGHWTVPAATHALANLMAVIR
jgi:membrane protease YdiL (CAAX protease family)